MHRVSFQVLCHQEWISAWNSDQQPRFIPINKLFQQFLVAGLQTVPSTISKYGQILSQPSDQFWHSTRSSSRISIHHAVLSQFFIHRDLLVTFQNFPTFPIYPSRAFRHVKFSTNSFNSLLLRSPASSPRYQPNTSLM